MYKCATFEPRANSSDLRTLTVLSRVEIMRSGGIVVDNFVCVMGRVLVLIFLVVTTAAAQTTLAEEEETGQWILIVAFAARM